MSLPLWLWNKTETHAATLHEDRSGYVRGLVLKDLKAAGLIVDNAPGGIAAQAIELAMVIGEDAVKAALAKLATESLGKQPAEAVPV